MLRSVVLPPVVASILAGAAAASADDSRPVPPEKDPVAMAFMLPRGMVLTAEEMKYATRVRSALEPQLRAALKRVETATDQTEKLKAVKEVKRIKDQIEAAILKIQQDRYAKVMQEYARRQAEARKKAAQQKKKKGGKKKRRR